MQRYFLIQKHFGAGFGGARRPPSARTVAKSKAARRNTTADLTRGDLTKPRGAVGR
jgi:hypothetical protein